MNLIKVLIQTLQMIDRFYALHILLLIVNFILELVRILEFGTSVWEKFKGFIRT